MPKVLGFLIISSTKLVQKKFLNLILIKPGFIIDISSIDLSFYLISLTNTVAKSFGDFLLSLDITIATLVEIS